MSETFTQILRCTAPWHYSPWRLGYLELITFDLINSECAKQKLLEEPKQHATFYTFRSRGSCESLLISKANKEYKSRALRPRRLVLLFRCFAGTMLQSLAQQSSDFIACYVLITFTRKWSLWRYRCLKAHLLRTRSESQGAKFLSWVNQDHSDAIKQERDRMMGSSGTSIIGTSWWGHHSPNGIPGFKNMIFKVCHEMLRLLGIRSL